MKNETPNYDCLVQTRLTKEQLEALRTLAKKRGFTLAGFLRWIIVAELLEAEKSKGK